MLFGCDVSPPTSLLGCPPCLDFDWTSWYRGASSKMIATQGVVKMASSATLLLWQLMLLSCIDAATPSIRARPPTFATYCGLRDWLGPNLAWFVFSQMLEIVHSWWTLYTWHTVEKFGLIAFLCQASHFPVFSWLVITLTYPTQSATCDILSVATQVYLPFHPQWGSSRFFSGRHCTRVWDPHQAPRTWCKWLWAAIICFYWSPSRVCWWVLWEPQLLSTDPRTVTSRFDPPVCGAVTVLVTLEPLWIPCTCECWAPEECNTKVWPRQYLHIWHSNKGTRRRSSRWLV